MFFSIFIIGGNYVIMFLYFLYNENRLIVGLIEKSWVEEFKVNFVYDLILGFRIDVWY